MSTLAMLRRTRVLGIATVVVAVSLALLSPVAPVRAVAGAPAGVCHDVTDGR